jgi:cytochrome oxidase Cu insertion factor (SCO1/SenC/PrrC family)
VEVKTVIYRKSISGDGKRAGRFRFTLIPALLAMISFVAAVPAQQAPKTHLKVGDAAPDFTLIDQNRAQVKLSDFKGKKNVVLAFYVLAFTGG